MKFKYQQEIDALHCSMENFNEYEKRLAYRWVFDDINDLRNFLPRYLLISDVIYDNCLGWALSFFASSHEAKDRFEHITKNKQNLYKKLGTHTAEGTLEKTHGISDTENALGHFSFFEYENVVLKNYFNIIEKLI